MANSRLEPLLLLAAFLIMAVWYAIPQAVYSLVFVYQILEGLVPGLVARIVGG